jgi:hypothetical protein
MVLSFRTARRIPHVPAKVTKGRAKTKRKTFNPAFKLKIAKPRHKMRIAGRPASFLILAFSLPA